MASADLLLHPVRLRIIKAFLGDRALTTTQLAAELGDVPAGSLYRHVTLLTRAGLLHIVAEHRIRGTVERTYALRQAALAYIQPGEAAAMTPEEHSGAFMAYVAGLLADFDRYLACRHTGPEPRPRRLHRGPNVPDRRRTHRVSPRPCRHRPAPACQRTWQRTPSPHALHHLPARARQHKRGQNSPTLITVPAPRCRQNSPTIAASSREQNHPVSFRHRGGRPVGSNPGLSLAGRHAAGLRSRTSGRPHHRHHAHARPVRARRVRAPNASCRPERRPLRQTAPAAARHGPMTHQ